MKVICTILFSFLFISLSAAAEPAAVYPTAKKGNVVDDFFGSKVPDPYRWMEEEKTPELRSWIDAENKLTRSFLDKIPYRNEIKKEITDRFNYPKYSLPEKKNGRYFYFKNDGLQNQSVLYTLDRLDGTPRVLLDPNTLSTDGTVSLSAMGISKDGKYLAWSVSRSGSDWQEAFVTEIATGRKLDDHLKWLKFSALAWAKDGFYYSRYDAPAKGQELSAKNEYHKVCYHKVGTSQDQDVVVFENRENPQRNCYAEVDEDENWLFIYESESTYGSRVLFKNLTVADSPIKVLYPDFKAESSLVVVRDGLFYLLTDLKAPNRRLVLVDPARPGPENWKDVVPESDAMLESVAAVDDFLVAQYLKDAADEAVFIDYSGQKKGGLPVPGLGSFSLSGRKGDSEMFYSFTSFLQAPTIYRYDVRKKESRVLFDAAVQFNAEKYVTERVWYTSKDGTKIPMFVTHRKDLVRNGSTPTLLYGYGGFNINMKPSFLPVRTVFLDRGGMLAVAILRGGGEYGENWHKAGTKLQKQNVFDDFIAAAEYLIREKYTSPKKLAINGGSNGGLLVGAAMTQRPDLFRVAVPMVGVLDMLRYHRFTIGWAWAVDYGTSEESREMFDALYAYSPLHRIRKGVEYPATLIMTSDHDDRVVPAHSFKFAATLQELSPENKLPLLIRIETKAGHGRGKPISKQIEEGADMYSFILYYLN